MKEIEVQVQVPDCTAQSYFDAIYGGDAALRAFHAEVNGDPQAAVGDWEGGARTVQFVLPVNVPAMLKKVIGLDAMPVVETQRVEWQDGRRGFRLDSEPMLNFPGANKFTTGGCLSVSEGEDGGCTVLAVMRCSAAMPWPMQSTVEGLMATEAATSIRVFLDWCVAYYATWRSQRREQAAEEGEELPVPPAAAAGGGTAGAAAAGAASAADGDMFYDALDEEGYVAEQQRQQQQRATAAAAAARTAAGPGLDEQQVVPYAAPRLEDVIVECLREIRASGAETARSLRALHELMANMDENIQALREKVAGRRRPAAAAAAAGQPAVAAPSQPPQGRAAGAGVAPAAARAAAGAPATPAAASGSGLGVVGSGSVLLAVAAVGAAGGYWYARYKLASR